MRIICPNCQNGLTLDAQYAGHKVQCETCRSIFTAPLMLNRVKSAEEVRYEQAKAERSQPEKNALGCAVIVLIVVAVGFFGTIWTDRETANDGAYAALREGTRLAKEILPKYLKSPSQTEILTDTIRVRTLPNGSQIVTGQLDSPNSFGVPLRLKWTIVLRRFGGEFRPVGIHLDGQSLDDPAIVEGWSE